MSWGGSSQRTSVVNIDEVSNGREIDVVVRDGYLRALLERQRCDADVPLESTQGRPAYRNVHFHSNVV